MALILLIGPDAERTSGIKTLLRGDGHDVVWHRDLADWRTRERDVRPEVIVATVGALDDLLARRGAPLRGFPAPLLWVEPDGRLAAYAHHEERLVDRLSTPFLREDLLGRIDALVQVRRLLQHRENVPATRPGIVARVATLLGGRRTAPQGPALKHPEVTARLAEWNDARDAFEPGHAERVMSCCATIADALRLPEEETTTLLRAAMLHDIGKVALPVEILLQPAPLDEHQRRLVRLHPRRGAALVRALEQDDAVADTILWHHERPDGNGYYGRGPAEIPRTAAILAVAELFDGLTNSRHGRRLTRDEALGQLERSKGATVDAACAEALVRTLTRRAQAIPLGLGE